MKTAVCNGHLVLADHLIPNGVLLIENGRISDYGEAGEITIPSDAKVLDAEGAFVGPGLIDIHTHSGGSDWFYENPVKAAAYHEMYGTTSVLPALYFNLSQADYLQAIDRIRAAAETEEGHIIRGLYMEGPYLNPHFGADQEHNPWNGVVNREAYMPLIERAGTFAKVWCVAPELEGILGFAGDVRAANPNVVFSVAHSEASPQQIEEIEGLRLSTHHTNATGDRPRYPECRGVCVDETVNAHDDIYAELICDSRGIHVDPYMQRLIVKIKGRDRVILISDACVFDGPIPPGYKGVTDINFDESGQIAGSKLVLSVACRNMMKHTGASLCDVFRYASLNPARLLGWKDRGQIKRGCIADLILVDYWMNVKTVLVGGQQTCLLHHS